MLEALRDNRRGMIIVVAIPMAAIMVGALWYLAAVGDAVLFRERLQDAADATAFENAVVHARGMNAVAMLNMLMAMFLAIIVIIRAVELILTVGLVFFGATAGPLTSVINIDFMWSERIAKVVSVLSTIEKGVAAGTPALSTVLASAHNTSFYRAQEAASGTVSFSYALLPAKVDAFLQVNAQKRWLLERGKQSGGPRLATALAGSRATEFLPSLPLEEDKYDEVCKRAILFFPDQLSGMAARLGMPSLAVWAFDKATDKVGGLIASYTQGMFCGSLQGAAVDLIGKAAGSFCDGELPPDVQTQEQVQEEFGDAGPPLPRAPDGGVARPTAASSQQAVPTDKPNHGKPKSATSGATDCKEQVKEQMKKGSTSQDEQLPARIWGPVRNGNVLLQTWAVAMSTSGPKFKSEDARGIEIMAPGKDATINADPTAWAEAEYYFDCSLSGRKWESCKPNTMWALGWTARMRRFWWPMNELQGAGDAYLRLAGVFSEIDRIVQNGMADFSGSAVQDLGQGVSTGLLTRDLLQSMRGPQPEWIH